MTGKHEVKRPSVLTHHIAHHQGLSINEWLRAEWAIVSGYDADVDRLTGTIIIDTSVRIEYDDSDTPTELWCRLCMTEVDPDGLEIDYV